MASTGFPRTTRSAVRDLRVATVAGGAILSLARVGVVGRLSRKQRVLELELRRLAEELVAEKTRLERIINALGAGLTEVDATASIQNPRRGQPCPRRFDAPPVRIKGGIR